MGSARGRVSASQKDALRGIFACTGSPQVATDWVGIAHDALFRKRAWVCSLAWPSIARGLGAADFTVLFRQYTQVRPYPPVGGSVVDGRFFAAYLDDRKRLPDAAKVQAMAFDLRYRIRNDDREGRRWPKLIVATIRKPSYLLIGVYLPWLVDIQVLRLRLGRRKMRAATPRQASGAAHRQT